MIFWNLKKTKTITTNINTAIMRLFLLFGIFLFVGNIQAQTLFTYGPNKVSSEEFSRAFRKNNTGNRDEKAMREYLDLYIRFKLKVQAAKDLRMDTLPSLKNDVAGFRAQVAEQYLEKNSYTKQMIQEAYDRSLIEVEAAHIFVAYDADSVAAKNKIEAAYQELKKGVDFGVASRTYSSDPYVKATDGYLDFISVFSLPYELETIVYTLKPGTYSTPVAGKNGWHIFKSISTRKNAGELLASQILFAFPDNASQEERSAIQAKADSVYGLLLKGMSFEEAAETWSNDKYTFQNGGALQEFKYTDCDPVFARAAFGLNKDGEITKPFKTNNGWHIVKRISLANKKKDLSDPETQQSWSDKVNGNPRIEVVNKKYQEKIRTTSGYKPVPYNANELWTLSDSLLETDQYTKMYKDHKSKKLFQLQDKTVSVADWFQFLKNKQSEANGKSLNGYNELMKEFTNSSIEQYYKDKLEKNNPEFRLQMQEFTEGSLLFEVMEKTIWSKAPVDSAGLLKQYEQNRSKYLWGPSADAIIFNCSDTATANKAYNL